MKRHPSLFRVSGPLDVIEIIDDVAKMPLLSYFIGTLKVEQDSEESEAEKALQCLPQTGNTINHPSILLINPTSLAKPHALQHLTADVQAYKPDIVVVIYRELVKATPFRPNDGDRRIHRISPR